MAAGGVREGSGRKQGSFKRSSAEMVAKYFEDGLTPLSYMLRVLREEPPASATRAEIVTSNALRFEAAKAAAPYMHSRLTSTEVTGANGTAFMPPLIKLVRDADSA